MIRFPTEKDYFSVRSICYEFLKDTPYSSTGLDENKFDQLWREYTVRQPNPDRLILVDETDGKITGSIAALSVEFMLTRDRISSEVFWWVYPEFRKSSIGLKLKEAYEFWAQLVGCRFCQVALHSGSKIESLTRLYRMHGYQEVERAFLKVL